MAYKRHEIRLRNPDTGKFEQDRVKACLVVGAVAEAALRAQYRPAVGVLPIPLVAQRPAMHRVVTLRDVLPDGCSKAKKTCEVTVHRQDAELALKVVRKGMSVFQQPPYNLEVCTVDHTGGSTCPTAHDLFMCTRVGLPSCLRQGLFSIELRCREVIDKKAFDWERTLTLESMPVWRAELQCRANKDSSLQGRIRSALGIRIASVQTRVRFLIC